LRRTGRGPWNLGQSQKPARVGGRGRDRGEGLSEFRSDLGHRGSERVDGIERVFQGAALK
jgi:hypothetical protein